MLFGCFHVLILSNSLNILKNYELHPNSDNMKKIILATTTIFGSWIGWWIGGHFGLMIAFLASSIGTGLGLYFGRRLFQL
jgi:hypothetical protein